MAQLPVKSPRIDPRFAPFRLEIRPSKIHRLGVYAAERIPANRKVIEYTGERLNRWQAKQRDSKRFTYLFAVDDYWTLDGAVNGSGAEIINHSCDPNLVSRVMKGHILYMSLRVDPAGRGIDRRLQLHEEWGRPYPLRLRVEAVPGHHGDIGEVGSDTLPGRTLLPCSPPEGTRP